MKERCPDCGGPTPEPNGRKTPCLICARRRDRARNHKRRGRRRPPSPEQRRRRKAYHARYHREHREEEQAKAAVKAAYDRGDRLAQGKVVREKSVVLVRFPYCPFCGNPRTKARLHTHHWRGHSRRHWYDGFQMCVACHMHAHALMREAELRGEPEVNGFSQFLREHGVGGKGISKSSGGSGVQSPSDSTSPSEAAT